jgi:hypothetical protein
MLDWPFLLRSGNSTLAFLEVSSPGTRVTDSSQGGLSSCSKLRRGSSRSILEIVRRDTCSGVEFRREASAYLWYTFDIRHSEAQPMREVQDTEFDSTDRACVSLTGLWAIALARPRIRALARVEICRWAHFPAAWGGSSSRSLQLAFQSHRDSHAKQGADFTFC